MMLGMAAADVDANGALLAPRLRPGDRVRLVSPASYPTAQWVAKSAEILRGWGLQVEIGDHALDRWGFMAGRDADRLSDLNDAFRDPGVRAIITTRGGAGAYRIADGIDADAVRADPKPVVGFSDITNLHLALWRRCRLVSIHGCLAGDHATTSLRRLLMTTQPITVHRDPRALSAAVEVQGRATGFLMGGSLGALIGAIGAGMPSLDGAILCVEGAHNAGEVTGLDRSLYHLVRSGALQGICGIAIGDLAGLDATIAEPVPWRWSAVQVLRHRLGALGVPILGGLPFGHLPDQVCLPLGTTATIDTTTGALTVSPAVR
jgi:muramoyltetrapeptide carboxypeptidase